MKVTEKEYEGLLKKKYELEKQNEVIEHSAERKKNIIEGRLLEIGEILQRLKVVQEEE